MSVGKKEHVFILSRHVKGVRQLHYLEVHGREELGAAQGATRMSAVDSSHLSDDISADLGCDRRQVVRVGHFVKEKQAAD